MKSRYERKSLGSSEKWLVLAIFVLLSTLVGCGPPPPPEVADGDSAPTFEATGIGGRKINFPASAEGKPSVVLMWATWCPYCKVLMPRLSDIRADYADRGVEVIAINAKERGRGDPVAYIRDGGWDFLTIVDDGDQIAEFYDVNYLPGLFVVDGLGTVVYRRKWTKLSAGQEIADLWEIQVRNALDEIFGS